MKKTEKISKKQVKKQELTPDFLKNILRNELKSYATRDDLRDELRNYVTKDDLRNELKGFVSNDTFEDAMLAIAKSFDRQEKSIGLILQEIQAIHSDNKYFKDTISSLHRDSAGYDRQLHNHDIRLEKLETQV